MTTGKMVSRKAPPANVEANTSVRTLILGIDRSGRIVQHDRTAPKILARSTDDLLGVHLSDITANPSDRLTGISINMLLDAGHISNIQGGFVSSDIMWTTQTSGLEVREKNVNFYQLEQTVSTREGKG